MPVHIYRDGAAGADAAAPAANLLAGGEYVSPWVDARRRSEDGHWELPTYACEIKGVSKDDRSWTPGQFEMGVDNVDRDGDNQIREWGGQKMWEGDRPPRNWDINRYPENVQALLKVPHMPGQPVKEMFARMKALDPRPFDDKYFGEILRDLVPQWPALLRRAVHSESFGVHSADAPAEWAGQEEELVPAVYHTPRPDAVTICVGVAGRHDRQGPFFGDAEYDYLELLYARDQEGKVIQILPFPNHGFTPAKFCTYSFVPPKGTTSITPYAAFKLRGAWRGPPVEWDPDIGSEEMQWFTEMGPELRARLAEKGKVQAKHRAEVAALRPPRAEKPKPVLWPESSWEGNAAKARAWDDSVSRQ